jgi:hypothetical protein
METHQQKFLVPVKITGFAFIGLTFSQVVSGSTLENTIDTLGLSEPIAISYGDHTANAEITPGVDIDGYTFQGQNGDQIRIVMSGLTGGFDPLIELRDPGGLVLQTQSCSTGLFTCAVSLDQALTDNGTYFLNLSDVGIDDAGAYTLHLDQYPPANNFETLLYDNPFTEQLGHEGDHDFLGFQGVSGTGVRVNVDGLTGGLDPHLQIWDPLGGLIADSDCNTGLFTCSFQVDLNLAISGTYKMAIFDTGFSDMGDYSLNVGCTFGDCTSVIPVPAAVWLFGSGLLGLVGIARRKSA